MSKRFDDSPHDDSDYIGPATVIVRGTEIPVEVEIRGYREPIDGVFRWIGRIKPDKRLTDIVGDLQRMQAVIRTEYGSREAHIGDPDLWGRYRIIGKSTPPFHIETDLDEIEAS